jgi:uncharacterized protein YbjT (DUF2867 family)
MYLIAGASSAVGRELVAKLLRTQYPVRVLVRKDADAAHFAQLGAAVVQGDVRDAAVVSRAAQGVTTLVSLIGRHFARTEAGLWDVETQGTAALIRAAQQAQVSHFVMLSALWADREPGPVLFRAKRRAEEMLMHSGLRYTILRPSMFVLGANSLVGSQGPLIERCGLALLPAPGDQPISFLTLGDLSDALLAAARDQGAANRMFEVGGPEALTLAEGARRIAAVLGKRVRLVGVPRWVLRVLRSLSGLIGFGSYEMMLFSEMLADHGYSSDAIGRTTRELLGREPQPVEVELRDYYTTRRQTPWADSVYGTLLLRNQ